MRIAMVGAGYVGLVSGACFAEFGVDVALVDTDADKVAALREGRTIDRGELIASLWAEGADDEGDVPNERTIDVHVRRLRSKLGGYEDIVRTVRGFPLTLITGMIGLPITLPWPVGKTCST